MFIHRKKINLNNLLVKRHLIKMIFNTVIENVFRSKIYKNNIFLFLKFYFDINISK
jgi:hypothetical protein